MKFGKLKALSVSAKLELQNKKKMEMPLAGLAFRSWPRRNKMCFEFHDLRWPVSDCNPTPEASHNFGAAFKLISAEGAGSAPERGWGYPQPRSGANPTPFRKSPPKIWRGPENLARKGTPNKKKGGVRLGFAIRTGDSKTGFRNMLEATSPGHFKTGFRKCWRHVPAPGISKRDSTSEIL